MTLDPPWTARDALRITGLRVIVTAPEGVNLVVVRIDTSDPGLYGLGCATFTQRYAAVVATLEQHVAPLVAGRHPADIGDIGRLVHYSSYWRNGPVLNSALSGVDMALWDIAGKRAGMPVYELLGGRLRGAVPVYLHASGADIESTLDDAERLREKGFRHLRLQTAQPGLGAYGAAGTPGGYPGAPYPDGWDAQHYLAQTPQVRAASPVPIAAGEQVASVADAARLVSAGGVDLLRCHISAIGGLTPGRKLADLCELSGVRTAWHAPADVSPVGAAANLALDLSSAAFGIQEGHVYADAVHEIFPGTPEVRGGYAYASEEPGWGITLNEKRAAQHPPVSGAHDRWVATVRSPDGALGPP